MNAPASRRWAFGPGLVHLLGSTGPNDLIANTIVGATYGYTLLWALIPAYLLQFVIAEASSRYVITTGKSITEGFARLGRPVVILLAAAVFIRRHLNNLFPVPLFGQTLNLLAPLPIAQSQLVWSLLSFALAFWLMFRGGYRGVEKYGRFLAALLTGSLVLVAIMSRPDPMAIAAGLLAPTIPNRDAALLLMALLGTSVGSINHLKYPAYVYERGWRTRAVAREQRIDLALSVLGQFALSASIQVAAAAALNGAPGKIRSVVDLSNMFSGRLGPAGHVVLALGMWASVFTTYVGSNTGYGLICADVYERYLRRTPAASTEERDAIRHRAFLVLVTFFCFSPLYVLFTSWEPFWLSIMSTAVSFALGPIIMLSLLVITNNREALGQYANSLASRLAITAAIVISVVLTYRSLGDLVARLAR